MDGTLLDSDGQVSPRNLAALRHAIASGAEVVIATGRRHGYAMRVLRALNLPPCTVLISSNGTVIRTLDAQLLHRSHLSLADARWLCSHVAGFRNTLMLTFDTLTPTGEDTPGALVCEHLDDLHASIGRWMQSNAPYIHQVPRLEDALNGDAPIQMMLCGPVARMAAAEARLLEHPSVVAPDADPDAQPHDHTPARIALYRTIYPDKDLSLVDILPAGTSKASALEHLAHLRGICPADIMAIGDNWNDLPMLRLAGRAVVMANAPADLLAHAHQYNWHIAPSNDDDGVAQIIEAALPVLSTSR